MKKVKEKMHKTFNFIKKYKKRIALFSFWAFLLLGLTVAYIAPVVGDLAKTLISAQSSTVDEIIFTKGDTIVLSPGSDNLNEGMGSITKTTEVYATIIANDVTKEATMEYSLYLDITENEYIYTTEEQIPELLLNITDLEGTKITSISGLTYYSNVEGLSGFDITTASGIFRILENYEIYGAPTSTDGWIITVSVVNLETDQSDNAEKTFSATIDLSADVYD